VCVDAIHNLWCSCDFVVTILQRQKLCFIGENTAAFNTGVEALTLRYFFLRYRLSVKLGSLHCCVSKTVDISYHVLMTLRILSMQNVYLFL